MLKYNLIIWALCLSGIVFGQIEMNFSDPVSVTNLSTEYGKHLPRISSLSDGTIVVFWSKGGSNPGMFLSKMVSDEFGDVLEISTGNLNPDVWSGALGPAFVCFENTIFVVFEIWGQGIYCIRSTDGGESFDDPVTAFIPDPGRFATLPAISIDNEGNPIIGFITTNSNEQDALYELVYSIDGGMTFGDAVVVNLNADGDEVCECCPSSITTSDEGHLFVSFRNNDNNVRDIWVSKSNDGGQSFPTAYDVDGTGWIIQGCPSTGPHTIIDGDQLITAFFTGAADWESGVYVSKVDLEGFSSGEPVKLANFEGMTGIQNYPRISGQNDTIGIVWHEHTGIFNNIAMSVTTTGIEGLGTAAYSPTDAPNPQVFPDIHYTNGKFHLVYEDQATGTVLYQTASLGTSTQVLSNHAQDSELLFYPNPATKVIHIEYQKSWSGDIIIEILNTMGQVLKRSVINKYKLMIDLKGLKPGLYIVRSSSDSSFQSQILMIQ